MLRSQSLRDNGHNAKSVGYFRGMFVVVKDALIKCKNVIPAKVPKGNAEHGIQEKQRTGPRPSPGRPTNKRILNCFFPVYANASARFISSSRPGSLGLRGLPGWMIETWQFSAASTSCA